MAPSPPFSLSPSSIVSFSHDSLAHRFSNRKRTTRNLQHWEYSTISRNQIWPRSRSRRWELRAIKSGAAAVLSRDLQIAGIPLGRERGSSLPFTTARPSPFHLIWIYCNPRHSLDLLLFFVCANFGKLGERGSLPKKLFGNFFNAAKFSFPSKLP